ncbi:MAG: GDSL-type esterase/lipase family protein [Oscillospiraceae bacterium]
MKKLAAFLPALMIASLMAGCADSSAAANKEVKEEEAAVKSIELKEENFKQLGRTYYNNGKIYCALSGSGAEFTFTGTEVSITIEGDTNSANAASADNQARVAVYVNGERKADEMINEKTKTINIKTSDSEQSDVKIVKISESQESTCAISDITVNGKDVKPAENKQHLIEFIGDSITCGYGVDDEDCNHHFSTKTEDCTKAYAYKTAEKLDADYSLVSYSGHGIISGYSGDGKKVLTQLVPPLYTHLGNTWSRNEEFDPAKLEWDFSKREPDVIVINLGTNDDSYCKSQEEKCEDFRENYVKFVKKIRENNPNAKIIGTLGIMGQNLYPYVEKALRDYSEETGDTNVDYLMFDQQNMNEDGIAADWHPSEKTHEKASDKLAEKIKESMGW